MKKTAFILASVLIVMAVLFITPNYPIAHETDYERYLNEEHLRNKQQELSSRIEF